ncbi:MAG: GNAT family N-acetyltransferase [Saprospiraceae bacterium]|nr:GNAT family N-acetyltransferase [Saprospiraceae bacterium]
MKIEVRKAKTSDFDEIHSLIKEFAAFIKTPERVLITPEQMLKDKDFFNCLIALDDRVIIGFATYFIAYYSWSGKAIYLDDLYVVPTFRGLGIGSKLFEHAIETAKAANCNKLKWQVSYWNNKAIAFYENLGATIDTVEINCELPIY